MKKKIKTNKKRIKEFERQKRCAKKRENISWENFTEFYENHKFRKLQCFKIYVQAMTMVITIYNLQHGILFL